RTCLGCLSPDTPQLCRHLDSPPGTGGAGGCDSPYGWQELNPVQEQQVLLFAGSVLQLCCLSSFPRGRKEGILFVGKLNHHQTISTVYCTHFPCGTHCILLLKIYLF
ncbi:mCG113646, isoform CRA_c, partial [Mus musculus]